MRTRIIVIVLVLISLSILVVYSVTGSGGFKRMVTLTGVYTICRPGNYDAVCFLDADSKEGGLFCLPLSQVGGECRK